MAEPTPTPTTSNPYEDGETAKARSRRALQDWSRGRDGFLRAAWRNILYYRGHQWVVFDRMQNRWRPSRLKRNTPTPVTNRFASTTDALISLIARVEPTLNYRPATDDPEDRAAADVAIRAVQVIEHEVDLRANRQYLAVLVALCGGAWLETGYDPDPRHGTRAVPMAQCPHCGWQGLAADACATCGNPGILPAMGPDGQPMTQGVPVGKMFVDPVPMFEMFFDPTITDWRKHRRFLRRKSVPVDDAKARWPAIADQIQPDSMASEADFYGESLPTLAAHIDDTQMLRGGAFGSWGAMAQPGQNLRVTEDWSWELPSEVYPEGLLSITVGKTVQAHTGPLPYSALGEGGQRVPFLPHTYFPMKLVPGTIWPKTPADDLAHIQARLNRIDALIELILMRTANPVWLLPEGCNVTNLTGEPGQEIRYNALGPANAKPERIPGQGLPAGLMILRERLEAEFDQLAATFDIIRGARPQGVSAGIALQILNERGMSIFAPMFVLWEIAWAEWAWHAMEIFREYVTEDRLLRIKGRDGKWQVQKFLGSDLQGRIDVIAEAGSSLPRSSLVERAEMEQLLQMGVLNLADPEVRFKVLEVYGKTNLTPAMAADTKQAIRENEAFEALAQNPVIAGMIPQELEAIRLLPPEQVQQALAGAGVRLPRVKPAVDDHAIHAREHRTWLKLESTQELPLAVQLLAEAHTAEHDRLAAAQMQAMFQARQGVQGAGFLQPPGSTAQNPMTSGSSPQRLAGDAGELVQDLSAGASP